MMSIAVLAGVIPGMSQEILTIKPKKPIVCYQSFENRHDHVGVSERFEQLRQRATARTKSATIEVEYINFPADNQAKAAFQFAVDIWETELISAVPIRIQADWRQLSSGVLGQAIWGSAHANFGNEQHMNTFYPVALAEKITGHDINDPDEPDILASFNSNASWYFGTDGNTPAGKMDMVTIVLHEIAHGLGFTDTYDVDGGQGSVGLANAGATIPFVFDLFVENQSDKSLMQDFLSPSQALGLELQSSKVFFNSVLSRAALSGERPKLYAPSTFDNGSSISHLDETTFNAPADANRLMTPQISFAESIHDPGTVLLASLADMGWVYTRIDHTPFKDTERMDGQPYLITATIQSDNGYDDATVELHYTTNGVNYTTVDMIPTGADAFQYELPGTTVEMAYAYYISVDDDDDRNFTSPGKIIEVGESPEQGTHYFRIGPDEDKPEIVHDAVRFLGENDPLVIVAEVTDNLGVNEVLVEYKVNDGNILTAVMQHGAGPDDYTVTIDLPSISMEDVIHYRLIARDLAATENVTIDPEDDFYLVDVTGIMPVQEAYTNNFDEPTTDFFGDSFNIITPQGFRNGAIHSNHPYVNGTGPNDESHYIYQLQIPIRIGVTNPVIQFDEIVLVEPGEEGAVFGGNGFYDYVVVEGSSDEGATWNPFASGYDARANQAWLNRYESDMSGDNSQAAGDSTLFSHRVINMLENEFFSEGDEVLVRFRLFADQLAHGWGWAIDNLEIQPSITSIEEPVEAKLDVYPVPANHELFVDIQNLHPTPILIEITDAVGRLVFSQSLGEEPGPVHVAIDLTSFEDGMYILRAKSGQEVYIRKFLKARK